MKHEDIQVEAALVQNLCTNMTVPDIQINLMTSIAGA